MESDSRRRSCWARAVLGRWTLLDDDYQDDDKDGEEDDGGGGGGGAFGRGRLWESDRSLKADDDYDDHEDMMMRMITRMITRMMRRMMTMVVEEEKELLGKGGFEKVTSPEEKNIWK